MRTQFLLTKCSTRFCCLVKLEIQLLIDVGDGKELHVLTIVIDVVFPLSQIQTSRSLPEGLVIAPFQLFYIDEHLKRRRVYQISEETILKDIILSKKIFPKTPIAIRCRGIRKKVVSLKQWLHQLLVILCSRRQYRLL